MTPNAIILMVVSILLVWGGLVASVVLLRTLPAPEPELDENGNVIDDPQAAIASW